MSPILPCRGPGTDAQCGGITTSSPAAGAAPMLTRFRWPLLALLLTPPAALFARPGWQSLEVGKGQYKLLTIDGRTDLVRVVEDKLQRLDGRTLAPLWTRGLTSKDQPSLPQRRTEEGPDPTATLRF